ncbi:protein adenylyltransferase SelO [Chitinilyticum piscinae]|uniref:Protein nucleotidyltransferase YdiU n=1 Tax=Chitinilyticum piscinae TaxID=2866724 RepID=A0A8J7KB45_9NEIS|nr:YdiU family protein [Chitinilyticum piscinae]MBE9609829.1 YdiU family protein [Chitinilyticum piscinae]
MPHLFHQLPHTPRLSTLGAPFCQPVAATPVKAPRLAAWNRGLAAELGLVPDQDRLLPDLAEWLSGNRQLPAHPTLATVYSGHQFGVNVPQLGDGRALLIAETTAADGSAVEIQLKGAGPTPYSRRADGRAVLRSSIREYLCSEAMHGLGIPTTRALALVHAPDNPVWREQRETAAIVTRVAPSFLRFGHFEYFYYRGEHDALRALADWTIREHFPACRDAPPPYRALFDAVIQRTAELIAAWQAVGFCHGVMNTDNMSLLGLTLDYGPFGFLDGFNAGHICNHSDETGRYAYNRQPQIALWNLYCLGQAFMPLLDKDAILAALDTFQPSFEAAFARQLQRKFGWQDWQEQDWETFSSLLELMQAGQTDWTLFWRTLSHAADQDSPPAKLRDMFVDRTAFDNWFMQFSRRSRNGTWAACEQKLTMLSTNPAYVLRNHLAEQAIRLAEDQLDYREIQRLADCLANPFTERSENSVYFQSPPDWAKTLSVSCSS